jgi:hypothetical protein
VGEDGAKRRMRAGARKRDGGASGTTAPLRCAALIRPSGTLYGALFVKHFFLEWFSSLPAAPDRFVGPCWGKDRASRVKPAKRALRALDTRSFPQPSASKRSDGSLCLTSSANTCTELGITRGQKQIRVGLAGCAGDPVTALYAVGVEPDHDAVMRIGGKSAMVGPFFSAGSASHGATAGNHHLGSLMARMGAETRNACNCLSAPPYVRVIRRCATQCQPEQRRG